MHLIVPATPGADWERLLPLLEAAGNRIVPQDYGKIPEEVRPTSWAQNTHQATQDEVRLKRLRDELASNEESMLVPLPGLIDYQLLCKVLDSVEGVAVIGLYVHPANVIARALRQGDDPDVTLRNWQQSANSLVHLFRSDRSRVRLFNAEDVDSAPKAFGRACRKHFGLHLSGRPIGRDKSCPTDEPLSLMLAYAWVNDSPGIPALLATLEACATPLAGSERARDPGLLIDSARERLEELEATQDSYHQFKERGDEYNAVVKELCRVQEGLEASETECVRLAKELESHKQQNEAYERKLRDVRKHRDRIRRDRDRIKRALNGMKRSHSWRITAPLRILRHPRRWSRQRPAGGSN